MSGPPWSLLCGRIPVSFPPERPTHPLAHRVQPLTWFTFAFMGSSILPTVVPLPAESPSVLYCLRPELLIHPGTALGPFLVQIFFPITFFHGPVPWVSFAVCLHFSLYDLFVHILSANHVSFFLLFRFFRLTWGFSPLPHTFNLDFSPLIPFLLVCRKNPPHPFFPGWKAPPLSLVCLDLPIWHPASPRGAF